LATYSIIGLAAGSICNIILDPILISGVGMGIAGASTATLVSQILSAIILLSAYVFRKSHLRPFSHLGIKSFLLFGKIFVTGLPSLFRQGLSGLATILLNRAARGYGEATVTALSLVARIFLLVFSVCLGIGQGMMPVVGYNMGSENPKRMRAAFRFSLIVGTISMLLIEIPLFVGAETVLSWFHQGDTEVLRVGASALRAQSAVLFTHGIVTSTILYLQATGHSIQGTILASARQGIFFLPLIFFLTKVFGLQGLICTQPTADAFAFLFSLPFLYFSIKRLKKACLK
jgi:Na+-driven multidrug efflux pump